MRVYATKQFARFARKVRLAASSLIEAAGAVMRGDYDANLGGGVYKQRIARAGGGKSGGFCAILFFRRGGRVFLAHGFAKNEKASLSPAELTALKRLADVMLGFSDREINAAVTAGELIEVECDDDGEEKN